MKKTIIAINLKNEDFNRTLKRQDANLFDSLQEKFATGSTKITPYFGEVTAQPTNGAFLMILVDNFGSFDNAQYLLRKCDTYEKVLELILGGSCKYPFVADTKNEQEWKSTHPRQRHDPSNIKTLDSYDIEYVFTFENGKWYYTTTTSACYGIDYNEYHEVLEMDYSVDVK